MDEKDNTPEIPFQRGQLLQQVNDVVYYQGTKEQLEQMEKVILELSQKVGPVGSKNFQNPRQEAIYLHDVKTLSVFRRQRDRLKQKLVAMQERIEQDMEVEKLMKPLSKFDTSKI